MDDDRLPAEIYDKIESMLMGLKKSGGRKCDGRAVK